MFSKIDIRYLKVAGMALGVIGAGLASITSSKEINAAVDKAFTEKTMNIIDGAVDLAVDAAFVKRGISAPTSD